MTYRELLSLYKKGALEEEKRQEIEADIEKQDAISEYLCEEGSIPTFDILESADTISENRTEEASNSTASEHDFIKTIQKTIRHAFIKMGIIVGTVVLAVTLFVVFALPHFTSLFYYNPNKIVSEENDRISTNQMSLDMAVYTELFIPGYYRDNVTATARGYGEYDIQIRQTSSSNGLFTTVSGYLSRNRLVLYDTNYLKRPADNVFLRTKDSSGLPSFSHGASGTPESALKKLQELQENTNYLAYITLEHLTEYEEFIAWFNNKQPDWRDFWVSVYAENDVGIPFYNIGFSPYRDGIVMSYSEESYPLLRCNGDFSPTDSETMKTHFVSMLNYMRDNETFFEMINQSPKPASYFDTLIRLIDEKGLQINGFAIVAEKEELLRLMEDENIIYIHTEPMR